MRIANFDKQDFLENYWQQKPFVIRQAFSNPYWLEPNELAGLACEEELESRIIRQQQGEWSVAHGPFDDVLFASLPERDWTLLVQAVDHWVPEVKGLLNAFDFLPAWRLDDVMVSYAPVGGTVSPHFDYYDVFLVQGEGKRRWQIGPRCDQSSDYLPNVPVKMLSNFASEQEVTLEPGDILYVPARYAHYGVSLEDSLTYSVGFRAPSIRDIVDGVATEAFERLSEDRRYTDTKESLSSPVGEIPQVAIEQVRAMLSDALSDDKILIDWLGKFVTEPKYEDQRALPLGSELDSAITGELEKNPASRFAYHVSCECGQSCELFVDGKIFQASLVLAERLLAANVFNLEELCGSKDDLNVINQLVALGALVIHED